MKTTAPPLLLWAAASVVFPAGLDAQRSPDPRLPSLNQVVLEAGSASAGVSYARRVGRTRLSIGAGLWGAFEPSHTFDRNVFEPIGGLVFARVWLSHWLHADLGPAVLHYYWADDCDECAGTFVGLRLAGRVGYRVVFVGPEFWLGSVEDGRNGSDFGAITHFQLRFVVGFGR